MSAQAPTPALLPDEDHILAYVHQERLKLYSKLTSTAVGADGDVNDPKLATTILKDMSSDALGRKRIKVDEKIVDSGAAAAQILAHVLRGAAQHKPWVATQPTEREAPVLGSEVPRPLLVAGELDAVGGTQETYETFTARNSPK